jgi:Aminoglycoside-2''-adenylyltransferase
LPLPAVEGSWRTLTPQQAAVLLSAIRPPWWIAGGWALDLFLGEVTRAHKDLDVGIFRSDAATVVAALSGWVFFEANNGVLTPLAAGAMPRAEVNSLWGRRADSILWEVEFMLDRSDGSSWIFRRDSRISRPLSTAIRRNPEGISYLAPEIQLLYKARATRARDRVDFDHAVSCLAPEARSWLRDSLAMLDPEHEWIGRL